MNDFQLGAAPAVSPTAGRQRFKTVDGHCYVLQDKIVITRDRKMTLGQAFGESQLKYIKIGAALVGSIIALASSLREFSNNEFYFGAAYLFLALLFGMISKSELSKSTVLIIGRNTIINVQYSPSFGIGHSAFGIVHSNRTQVLFTDIYLPRPTNHGQKNTQKALELMDDLLG